MTTDPALTITIPEDNCDEQIIYLYMDGEILHLFILCVCSDSPEGCAVADSLMFVFYVLLILPR